MVLWGEGGEGEDGVIKVRDESIKLVFQLSIHINLRLLAYLGFPAFHLNDLRLHPAGKE